MSGEDALARPTLTVHPHPETGFLWQCHKPSTPGRRPTGIDHGIPDGDQSAGQMNATFRHRRGSETHEASTTGRCSKRLLATDFARTGQR